MISKRETQQKIQLRLLVLIFLFTVTMCMYSNQQTDNIQIPSNSIAGTEQMIDVGGRKLNCFVYGNKAPTVVLISGLNAPQTYWNSVIPDIAEEATVVTYDRPGYGKSETGDLPLHGERSAKDLSVLLEKLSVPKPYIIAGHSYGGDIARLFASMYSDDIGGLILEDTQHEDILDEQRKLLKGQDLQILEDMVKRMSQPDNPKTELDYRAMTTEQLQKNNPLPTVPYVVITSGERSNAVPPIFSTEAQKQLIQLGKDLQLRLVKLIPDGKHIIAEGVGHHIHIEKPEIVINAIRNMIDEIVP